MEALEIVVYICLAFGLFFNCLGSLGLLRFPDVYTRLHTATKATTFGSIFTSLAVIIYGFAWWIQEGYAANGSLAFLAIFALVFLLITNPTGAHAIARAAYRSGVKPWGVVVDQLEVANNQTNAGPEPAEGGETDA